MVPRETDPEEYYWELGGYDPEIRYYGGLVTIFQARTGRFRSKIPI